MTDMKNGTQPVRIALNSNSSACSVHLGETDITHLVNEISVQSKVGHPLRVFLGLTPFSSLVTVDGWVLLSADKKAEAKA